MKSGSTWDLIAFRFSYVMSRGNNSIPHKETRPVAAGLFSIFDSGCSYQCRYSVVAGGEVTARLTCRVILFSSLFDLGTGCIIAVMCLLDGTYPSSSLCPSFVWSCP
jgi:hypothetical protein